VVTQEQGQHQMGLQQTQNRALIIIMTLKRLQNLHLFLILKLQQVKVVISPIIKEYWRQPDSTPI
jgi:hypothetical protein